MSLLAKEAFRLLAWGSVGFVGLMLDGIGGMGFLSQVVQLPLWALLLIFALPMEAVVTLVMRYVRGRVEESEPDQGG